MKSLLLDKFKDALISNEEAKTIFGGYGLDGGLCNTPLCTSVQSSPVSCGGQYVTTDGMNFRYFYGYTRSFNYITLCKAN